MRDWFDFPHIVGYAICLLGLSATLYYMNGQPAVLLWVLPSSPSFSVPIYYPYANLSSLPNVRIDKKLGFIPHFLAFTFDWEMLNQCLNSFHKSDVDWQNLILVDNSPGKLAVKRRDWLAKEYGHMIITILPTFSLLSFSHLQNLFLSIAQQSKCRFYSWSHMDIMLLPFQEDWKILKQNVRSSIVLKHIVYNKFLDSVRLINNTKSNWGVIFYGYDQLTAVRTDAYISTGPFDIAIPQYTADCDYYRRLELKGYQLIDQQIVHVFHMPKILEYKFREEIKTCNWKRAKEILYTAANNRTDNENRTRWRLYNMRVADREAESILKPAGRTYFQRKWGTNDCRSPKKEPNWNLNPILT